MMGGFRVIEQKQLITNHDKEVVCFSSRCELNLMSQWTRLAPPQLSTIYFTKFSFHWIL